MTEYTAQNYAYIRTSARFGKAPKVKINRKEYADAIEMAYHLGKTQALYNVIAFLKSEPSFKDDVLLGDLQLEFKEAWDDMRKSKDGRLLFSSIEIEDIVENKSFEEFAKINVRQRS